MANTVRGSVSGFLLLSLNYLGRPLTTRVPNTQEVTTLADWVADSAANG